MTDLVRDLGNRTVDQAVVSEANRSPAYRPILGRMVKFGGSVCVALAVSMTCGNANADEPHAPPSKNLISNEANAVAHPEAHTDPTELSDGTPENFEVLPGPESLPGPWFPPDGGPGGPEPDNGSGTEPDNGSGTEPDNGSGTEPDSGDSGGAASEGGGEGGETGGGDFDFMHIPLEEMD